jgi:glucokinase
MLGLGEGACHGAAVLSLNADSILAAAITGSAHCNGEHVVGIEVGPALIRAGVFGREGELLGKTKLSTKLERGPDAVLARVERCVAYAADECDLVPGKLRGVGIGLPGQLVDGEVRVSSALGWHGLEVQRILAERLCLPVAAANAYNLAASAIAVQEFPTLARPLVVLFAGSEIGVAVLLEQGWATLDAPGVSSLLQLPDENVLHTMPASEFSGFRGRDIRKAIRAGSTAAREFVLQSVHIAAEAGENLCQHFGAKTLVLAGGALDEVRDEVLKLVQARVTSRVASTILSTILVSRLGEAASLAGAGWVARGLIHQIFQPARY